MPLSPDDPRLSWPGAVSLQRERDWVQPWRLPYQRRGLFPPEALRERAAMPAGVRIRLRTDATAVAGQIEAQPEMSHLDICCDGALVGSLELADRSAFRFAGLPPGQKTVELWLPQFGEFRLRELDFTTADGRPAALEPDEDPGRRWVTYGSSITQCRTAASPTQTWPAIVARARGLNLTCLGFGGQCHLDPMVARLIRDLPADYLSICAGINIYGAASLGPRSFGPALIGTVQIVREGHPDTPLALISPIFSPPRETTANAVGLTLEAMREEVAGAVEQLRAHGDRNVHYVDGLRVFGPELAERLPDELHPDAEGYRLLGANFLREVADRHFPAAGSGA
jgi:lysophospholipase L1-like esterase